MCSRVHRFPSLHLLCAACCLPLCFWSNPTRQGDWYNRLDRIQQNFFEWTDQVSPTPLQRYQQAALPCPDDIEVRWLKPGALISTIYINAVAI